MFAAPARTVAIAAAVTAALGLSACGSDEPTNIGLTEGAYVDVGDIAYQVQISRVLNPKGPEDPSYLVGVPAGDLQLGPNEQWFAVFLRAQNFGGQPLSVVPASQIQIRDTDIPKGQVYRPVSLDAQQNVFAWNPTVKLDPDFLYPDASSIAGTGPVRQGGELLFKIKNTVYQNRPLILEILGADGKLAASVNLDL